MAAGLLQAVLKAAADTAMVGCDAQMVGMQAGIVLSSRIWIDFRKGNCLA